MSNDPHASIPIEPDQPAKPGPEAPRAARTHKGVRIFTYPKIVFIIPTFVTALICGIGMYITGNHTEDPKRPHTSAAAASASASAPASEAAPGAPVVRRFGTAQNLFGVIFILVFGLNVLVLSVDFPRFTVIALILGFAASGFFLLWLNVYFELLPPLVNALEGIYAVANTGFYFLFATALLINLAIVWATRYLDYWEILPNEVLHNHGPFSDLERFPTINMKFDKEIPDILEYALLRAGRLVLHIPGQSKAIVLNNVLWINTKEEQMKKLLSRMEVRVTTDKEASSVI